MSDIVQHTEEHEVRGEDLLGRIKALVQDVAPTGK